MVIIFVLPTGPARQVAEAGEGEIHLLAVHLEARGQGIALHLVRACEKLAAPSGHFMMVLSIQQSVAEAHRLYERFGYRQNPARD